jgi:disulfide bond formation protein DsbB
MKFELTQRRVFAALALIPLALVCEALILQHLQGQAPCPLCVLDRAAFLLFALIALAGAIHDPPHRVASRYALGMALAAASGLGVAGWHLWSLHHPKFGCGIDVMEQFVNNLPTARLLPFLFHASGDCSARLEPMFGLVTPEWAFAWFAALFLAAAFLIYKWRFAVRAGTAN